MAGVSKIGDLCSGHGNCRSRPIITGSSNVFVNGVPVSKVGDSLAVHCTHPGTIITGSVGIFVNGSPIASVGSSVDCGSVIITGSSNVFVG